MHTDHCIPISALIVIKLIIGLSYNLDFTYLAQPLIQSALIYCLIYSVDQMIKSNSTESERKLSLFMNSRDDGVIMLKDLKIIEMNKLFRQMMPQNASIKDILSTIITIPDEKSKDTTSLMNVISKAVNTQCFGLVENAIIYHIDIRHMQINSSLHTVVTIKNINIPKDKYESTESISYMNSLATVSHNMRAPLCSVMGMLSILEEYVTNEGKKFLQMAHCSASFMCNLTNKAIGVCKLSQNKMVAQYELFDIRKMLSNVIQLYTLQSQQQGVQLLLEIDDTFPQ
jgi:signal transduction histidine kinase